MDDASKFLGRVRILFGRFPMVWAYVGCWMLASVLLAGVAFHVVGLGFSVPGYFCFGSLVFVVLLRSGLVDLCIPRDVLPQVVAMGELVASWDKEDGEGGANVAE